MSKFKQLVNMLTYKRPYQSDEEEEWIERFIDPLNVEKDKIGNRIKIIGDDPTIMFSCHTDTVHAYGGRQNVYQYTGTSFLCKNDNTPLGADDAAGAWIMMQMIEAKIPGVYVFHRGEEVGAHGSRFILKENMDLLKMCDAAIAFDRRGTKDIITAQGSRTASDEFAWSLSKVLDLGHVPARGVFTDTKVYSGVIPECTNVSVGYYNEHTSNEKLDVYYLFTLMKQCLKADWTRVTIHRDPTEVETPEWRNSYSPTQSYPPRQTQMKFDDKTKELSLVESKDIKKSPSTDEFTDIIDLCEEFPEYVAEYLEETGTTFSSLDKWVSDAIERDWSSNDQSVVV